MIGWLVGHDGRLAGPKVLKDEGLVYTILMHLALEIWIAAVFANVMVDPQGNPCCKIWFRINHA